ncbi:MAG: flagellar cap protein FliD N-terminal domain-containing protein, partial [Propionivibrio sp.]
MATASVSSLGVGSNLDLSSILTKLMTAESEPLTALQSKITATNTKLSAFGTLKAKLATLQDTASKLKSSLNLNAMGASSSDSTIAKATTAFNAAAGTYTIKVDQLASAQKSFSNALASDAKFTSGTLDFDFNGTVKSVELTGQTSYSLNDVRSAINAAGIGVTATVVSGDAGARLVLTRTQPGAS